MTHVRFLDYIPFTDDEFWKQVFKSISRKKFQKGSWYKSEEDVLTFQADPKIRSTRVHLDLSSITDSTGSRKIIELHQSVLGCYSPTDKRDRRIRITEMIDDHTSSAFQRWSDVRKMIDRGALVSDFVSREYPEMSSQTAKTMIRDILFATELETLSKDTIVVTNNRIESLGDIVVEDNRLVIKPKPVSRVPPKVAKKKKKVSVKKDPTETVLTRAIGSYIKSI